MSFAVFCSFLSYALIAAVTPGPNNILALGSAAAHGLRRSAPCSRACARAFWPVMLLCASVGLALQRALPDLADRLVWPGAIYILWLAGHLAVQKVADSGEAKAREKSGENRGTRPLGFWSGFVLQFVNGKILLCGLTALSVFVLPHVPRDSAQPMPWLRRAVRGPGHCLQSALGRSGQPAERSLPASRARRQSRSGRRSGLQRSEDACLERVATMVYCLLAASWRLWFSVRQPGYRRILRIPPCISAGRSSSDALIRGQARCKGRGKSTLPA